MVTMANLHRKGQSGTAVPIGVVECVFLNGSTFATRAEDGLNGRFCSRRVEARCWLLWDRFSWVRPLSSRQIKLG